MSQAFHIIIISILVVSSAVGQSHEYRHSADFTEQIVYLTNGYAIVKAIAANEEDEASVVFEIVRAHWEQEPELAAHTGDVVDRKFVSHPLTIGVSDDLRWLTGEAQRFDWELSKNVRSTFVLDMMQHRFDKDGNISNLYAEAGAVLSSVRAESVHVFFDRWKLRCLTLPKAEACTADDNGEGEKQ